MWTIDIHCFYLTMSIFTTLLGSKTYTLHVFNISKSMVKYTFGHLLGKPNLQIVLTPHSSCDMRRLAWRVRSAESEHNIVTSVVSRLWRR